MPLSSERTDWLPEQQERLLGSWAEQAVDIHCHCLPGIDDGPSTLDDSLRLCQALAEDGITTVFATPHQLGSYGRQNSAKLIRELVGQLQSALSSRGIPLEILPGSDVRIDERLCRLLDQDEVLTVGDIGKHLLLELPHDHFVDPSQLLASLIKRNLQPVMTHPERHRYLQRELERVEAWVDQGAIIQVTAGSLVGDFGEGAYRAAWTLVDEGLVHTIATDAHHVTRRPPRMTAAMLALREQAPGWLVQRMCLENPYRMLSGQFIQPGPIEETIV